jgi:hypothetical protein
MIKDKRIIVDSIKYHLIPQFSSNINQKYMFESLTIMYQGNNINWKMKLRTQLTNTKVQKGEIVQDYLSMVSQFKEQLEEIGDNLDEYEIIMTTLNGITRPWDEFIQTFVQEKRNSNLTVYGKNVFKKKQEWPTEKSSY